MAIEPVINEINNYILKIDPYNSLSIELEVNNLNDDISDLSSLSLTHLGNIETIIIANISGIKEKNRWLNVNNQWYQVGTYGFKLKSNSNGIYDVLSNQNEIILPIEIINEKILERYKIESIDTITLFEAFGSHYKIVIVNNKMVKVFLPHK